jgi:uncharacterized protein
MAHSGRKILFSGTAGVGKTTAISSVSEIPPKLTHVYGSSAFLSKDPKVVGLDYGELTLENGETVRLYGNPGATSFDSQLEILSKGTWGLIILIDNRSPDPLGDLDTHIAGFKSLIKKAGCVVAICHMSVHPQPDTEAYANHLQVQGVLCPVLPTDVLSSTQVTRLLELVLVQLDVKANEISEENGWS